jgi:L-threonylcarbamoyladenylate synthase
MGAGQVSSAARLFQHRYEPPASAEKRGGSLLQPLRDCSLNNPGCAGRSAFISTSQVVDQEQVSSESSETQLLAHADLSRAADLLRSGNLVAFPTDTFFALGAVLTESAVSSLFAVKGRMAGNPVPVLLSSADQIDAVAEEFPDEARKLAGEFWPGPLTLVLPARDSVPTSVTAHTGTVGVRVPAHAVATELISKVGSPLTGTSANISGMPPGKTSAEVVAQLSGKIAAIVDAPCGDHVQPSTVVRFDGAGLTIIRVGAISEDQLLRVLNTD